MRVIGLAGTSFGLVALVVLGPATPAAGRAVNYIPSERVAAGFAKGMPLVEQENYKVHASRRDAPGQVEVHARDTDIIHVLTGTATFVTGLPRAPTAVDPADPDTNGTRGAPS